MLHSILLTVHSGLRWLVLIMLVVVLVNAVRGWRSGAELQKRDRAITSAAIGFADLQLLVGLSLYLTGPWLTTFREGMGHVMRTTVLRFFVVEHVTGMLVALAVLHIASVRSKRADEPKIAWRRLAIGVGLALLIIFASIPWPFMPYGRPLLRFG
ncbi:MAG: hypothetical protein H6719_35350 [Sandaracinaceae bacterium]|nr:hypothetical protein [Sandaracinaceae bacterium]